MTASAGVFGANVNSNASLGALGQPRHDRQVSRAGGSGSANPSRRRDRTCRVSGSSMSPTGSRCAEESRSAAGVRAPPRPASATDRWRRRARRAAPLRSTARRCRNRHRAAACRSCSAGSHDSSVLRISSRPGAHRGPDAADRRVRGQPRPGLDRGAVEIGLKLAAAFEIGCDRTSVEPQQIEDFAVLQRFARQAARRPCPECRRRAACIRPARLRVPASASISNSVDFFSRLLRMTSRSGKCATRLQARRCSL